jgi:hypothetical protein
LTDVYASALWLDMLDRIKNDIDRYGYWSGEARALRDAAGIRRLTPTGSARIAAALSDAGFECEPPAPRYESEPVLIGRIGSAELALTIEQLLPAIREADRMVPSSATFRDANVARQVLRAWPGRPGPSRRPSPGPCSRALNRVAQGLPPTGVSRGRP